MLREVNNGSESCQTINGTAYIDADAQGKLVICAAIAASTPAEASTDPLKTRSAYNVLVDLVTALGSGLPGSAVRYTLLSEADLTLAPALEQGLADARQRVKKMAAA